ncbi:LpqB family beta-propeller domain-containing protein [Nocardioides sp. LHG3406-4]|uniref:LpqB family beta-propeller domain-containing protein n=1 Tax=Nocardioides sp. LHG3406-4 TaxID=2804575 RepID=UPI003CEBB587
MSRTLRGVVVVMLSLLALTGCVRIPTEGPVVESEGRTAGNAVSGTYYDPPPPQQGASANEIVIDFLEAMKATPIRTSVAQEYLTQAAQKTWKPEAATITYDEIGEPVGDLTLSVPITGVNEYDGRGAWTRQVGNGAADGVPDAALDFRLTVEDDEWRISELPDALVVPSSWFDDRFRRVSLYFFDPTAQVLVPEPVFVPEGDQFAGALLRGLLAGPGPSQAARSFIPEGLEPGLSVPISPSGVADVSMLGEIGDASRLVTEQMLAQLVWTLRQEPRIQALRLSLGAEPIPLPGGESEVSISSGGRFDPNGVRTNSQLFALRDGLLITGGLRDQQPTDGPFGAERLGLRAVSVNLTGDVAAGVSGQGTTVLTAPVDASDERATVVLSGAVDLLRPAWDFSGRLWLVDANNGRARVSVLVDGQARELAVPGVTGKRVVRFLVSRDGTRFAALVRGAREDKVVAARVLHDAQGRVLRVGESRRLDLGEGQSRRIRDIGWRSMTSLAILNRITDDLAQVRTVAVDGAPGDAEPPVWLPMRGNAESLVTSPVEGQGVYVLTSEEFSDVTDPDRRIDDLDPKVASVGYAG